MTTMPHTQPPPDAMARWLDAERSGLDDAAEAALAELLVELPRPAPPAGFAERVLALALPAPRRRRLERRAWGWRAALGLAAAAVMVLSLASFWLPAAARVVGTSLRAASIAGLLQAGIDAIITAGEALASAALFANKLLLLVRAVAEPLASPPVAVLAGACLLVSVLALRLLYDLVQRDRRWVYADPI
ncbi:MAG TPA: hypothetical protein VE075_03610 [Thermoanaerobaculia bacterium]|nr:hypothetical protein [Thermoanaerobaculia bacterium]